MSETKHYLTSDHVIMEAWDPEHEALKFIPSAGTEFGVELRAEDGDSVTAHKRSIIVEGVDPVSCVGLDKACLYGVGDMQVSPSDTGNDFVTITSTAMVVMDICARRIKITGTGKIVAHG